MMRARGRPEPPRAPSQIIRVHEGGVDVIPERGGHVRDGAGDPAEPGDRGDGQQHAGDLVFGRARRQRGGGAPFQADPRCSDRRQRPHPRQRRGLGIQPEPGQAKPQPGLVLDEAFVDDRQPAQDLLESHRLVHSSHLAAGMPPWCQANPSAYRASLCETVIWSRAGRSPSSGPELTDQLTSPAASRTALSMSFGLTSSSLATCFSAFSPAFSTACSTLLSPTMTRAACPSSMTSPNSLTSARDMPRHRWPPTPPAAAPTAAPATSAGGNKMPTTAPAAAPPHAPCRVAISSLFTCTLPPSSLVTTAAS